MTRSDAASLVAYVTAFAVAHNLRDDMPLSVAPDKAHAAILLVLREHTAHRRRLAALQALADDLAAMKTDEDLGGAMSGDDAVSALAGVIEQARALSDKRPAKADPTCWGCGGLGSYMDNRNGVEVRCWCAGPGPAAEF